MTKQSGYSLEHIAFEGKAESCTKHARPRFNRGTSAIKQEPMHAFAAWVLESIGLPADAYRGAPMRRRLTACLRALKVGSAAEAWSLVQNPESAAVAVDSLMIGVTEFFRDGEVFDALREIVTAKLTIQRGPIRVWSAGCSNGAELYSLAILLAESGLIDRSILVGTDCRVTAIREAQYGIYSESSIQSMDASLRQKYIRCTEGRWRVVSSLRRRTQWQVGNVLSGIETGPWDIILWRNMAIYLNLKPATQVWNDFIKGLRPEGLLVVGKAERPPESAGLMNISRCIYQSPLLQATGR